MNIQKAGVLGSTPNRSLSKFSYDLVVPASQYQFHSKFVIEKGLETSRTLGMQRYELSLTAITSAMSMIDDYVCAPRCDQSLLLRNLGFNIYLKRDLHQQVQNVKERGIIYTFQKLLEQQNHKGVVAISTGSFAYNLCQYGLLFKIPVTVVMPNQINYDHVTKCINRGNPRTTVLRYGNNMLEAHAYALRLAQKEDLFYLDGNDHPNMIIGQATLGLEIIKMMQNIDAVILPTVFNNCGLTMGIAFAIKEMKPEIEVIKVQPLNNDPLVELIRSKTMLNTELDSAVHGYQWYVSSGQKILFSRINVTDVSISVAAKLLKQIENVDDYYAAIGFAAIVDGQLNYLKGKRVVIPLFGVMDSFEDLKKHKSDPMAPHAGPTTSQN